MAEYLTETYSQPAIVDNKTGANGAIAWRYVAEQKPDGYTLMLSTQAQIVILPASVPSMNLDPINGLTHITTPSDCASTSSRATTHR